MKPLISPLIKPLMKPLIRPLSVAWLAVAAAILAWLGARYGSVPNAFGAFARHDSASAPHATWRHGMVAAPRAASGSRSATLMPGAPAKRATTGPAALAAVKGPDEEALAQAARRKLAALRAPLSPEAQNDPFSVLSWLPPPPPPPAPVAEAVQAPAPVAPPLPFTFVGISNASEAKPQVFLADGEQLLIVSPGDVIDGRYRFESIAATAAVFTYLPLDEKQVMTIEGEGN